MILRLALIGFGNVGREFARLLVSRRGWLRETAGLDVDVVAVATKTRGSLMSNEALNLGRVLKEIEVKGHLSGYGRESTDLPPVGILQRCGADIMVELTTLNIDSGRPAIDHIEAAFNEGMHVITANKGPIAHAYHDLKDLASKKGLYFRFEGTVMDGAPVFSLVERTLPGCEVLEISGILNSTCNYILTEMTKGRTMDEALGDARRLGITEADPSLDIDGWDAAAKITALANVLMGARSKPSRVDRSGIRDIDPESVMNTSSLGTKIKLVARAEKVGGEVRTTVRPEPIGIDSPFWPIDGTSSALTLRTDLMGEITVVESNPTVRQTAYAVFSDLLIIAESIKAHP